MSDISLFLQDTILHQPLKFQYGVLKYISKVLNQSQAMSDLHLCQKHAFGPLK